jgi:hypothetical protein
MYLRSTELRFQIESFAPGDPIGLCLVLGRIPDGASGVADQIAAFIEMQPARELQPPLAVVAIGFGLGSIG